MSNRDKFKLLYTTPNTGTGAYNAGDFNRTVKYWKRFVKESGIMEEYHSRLEYLSKSQKRKNLVQMAKIRQRKLTEIERNSLG